MKLGLLFITTAVLASPLLAGAKATIDDVITKLENSQSPLLQYPTQLTQDIVPKQIHSHNDYWRDVPLLTALSFGAMSVEADVYLINGTLFVGHEQQALTQDRTFDALYIQPLLKILAAQNPKTKFTQGLTGGNGPFDTASDVPLQLLIEMKTNGAETLPAVLKALQPLRSLGYLTTATNGTLKRSAVTAVGTGNTPLDLVKKLEPRDLFYDAPLGQLTNPSLNTTWDPTLSPLASDDYAAYVGWNGLGNISDAQKANVTKFVGDAHARGILARFWGAPAWPVSARDNIWRTLLENGVDWVNADDLEAAANL